MTPDKAQAYLQLNKNVWKYNLYKYPLLIKIDQVWSGDVPTHKAVWKNKQKTLTVVCYCLVALGQLAFGSFVWN